MRSIRVAPLAAVLGLLVLPGTLAAPESPPANGVPGSRPALVLENEVARVVADLSGGALGEFRLRNSAVNPLSWESPAPGDLRVHGFGHFLCLDRWGPPSDAEGARGMPYHGEASNVPWERVGGLTRGAGRIEAVMACRLPKAGLAVRRALRLAERSPVLQVTEEITNENALGRIFNAVQHPTIAPPFLDEGTIVDCNGGRGFAQGGPMPNPEEPLTTWPRAVDRRTGATHDLRHLTADPEPNVASFTIEAEFGWITAASPSRGLLLGYVWRSRDYPWVSVWRDVHDGKPSARGLEFGTTGLHQPFATLVRKGRILGRPLFEYLDAGETVVKRYTAFLLPIPADLEGVDSVTPDGGRLVIRGRAGGTAREFAVELGELADGL